MPVKSRFLIGFYPAFIDSHPLDGEKTLRYFSSFSTFALYFLLTLVFIFVGRMIIFINKAIIIWKLNLLIEFSIYPLFRFSYYRGEIEEN